MSKRREPQYTLSYLRAEFPDEWVHLQRQIVAVLRNPPPVLAFALRNLSPAQAHAAIEACLDMGSMQFLPVPGDPDHFALLVYDHEKDHYLAFTEDGEIHPLEDTYWALPEDGDE